MGGRPARGSLRWHRTANVWEVRVTLIDGKRTPPIAIPGLPPCVVAPNDPPRGCTCEACKSAVYHGGLISSRLRSGEYVEASTLETAREWFTRYLTLHAELGNETRGMGSFDRWCQSISTTSIAEVTREQIVSIRDAMTKATLAKENRISAKRVANLWSELIKAPFSRAFTDDDPKYSSVRVGPANANPAIGIKPPVSTKEKQEDRRERQALFPRDFDRLMSCAAVPIEWRRLYAISIYLFVRPEELYALRWSDVDWEAQEVRVRRSMDLKTGEEKPTTKTKAGRREVPIHANLMPLLTTMQTEANDRSARIVPLATKTRDVEKNASTLRRHLVAAKIDRDELLEGSGELMPVDFRSLRTTGCTWHAMLGTDSYALARWAGHESPDVTWGHYAKQGPDLRRRHGEPFPALPTALLSPASPPESFGGVSVFRFDGMRNYVSLQCEGGDLNPYGVTR